MACAVAGHDDDHRIPKTEVAVGDYAAILSLLLARKATCLLALILIASPVAGLRPLRAARFAHLQDAEPADLHPLAFLQVPGDHDNQIVEHLLASAVA
jgi:hypothetical protein